MNEIEIAKTDLDMDYEKILGESLLPTYEQLKRGLLQLIDEGKISREDAARVLPELRESEDERIRKWLVDYFGSIKETVWIHRDITCEQILTYLEKQKEQKEELVYRLNGLMQDYIKEGKDDEEKEHRLKCYQLFWDALEDANFFEQKEQKPAEWSEEDKTIIEGACYALEIYGHTKLASMLKSLRPSWKPSEEQMKALNKVVNGEVLLTTQHKSLESLYEQLKKL